MNENLISAKEDAKQNLNNIQDWIKAADTKFSILLGVVAVLFGLTTVVFKSLPYIANNEFSATVFFVALFTALYILSTVTTLLICLDCSADLNQIEIRAYTLVVLQTKI